MSLLALASTGVNPQLCVHVVFMQAPLLCCFCWALARATTGPPTLHCMACMACMPQHMGRLLPACICMQTIAFRMLGSAMYDSMSTLTEQPPVVSRGIALHKVGACQGGTWGNRTMWAQGTWLAHMGCMLRWVQRTWTQCQAQGGNMAHAANVGCI